MASIMKRGNTYSVRYNYKDHAGKPCKGWETFKTKAEAQERKITVEKELLDGTFLVPDTMTVEEMLYKWIPIQSSKHKWSPKTYTQSVAMVQNLIVPYIGKRKVQDLRTYDIEQFYATLSDTQIAPQLRKATWSRPKFPVYCNAHGKAVTDGESARESLLVQMTSSVRWIETVRNQYADGARRWLELGPKAVLGKMVAPCLAGTATADDLAIELVNNAETATAFAG